MDDFLGGYNFAAHFDHISRCNEGSKFLDDPPVDFHPPFENEGFHAAPGSETGSG
jgi:hypothetical protein